MDLFTRQDLQNLMEMEDERCLSIYMPTERVGSHAHQNPIRWKNRLTEAREKLEKAGMDERDAQQWLEPLNEQLNDEDFWQHQADGLAVFFVNGEVKYWRLPLSFPELTLLQERPYVKPLLPLLSGDGQFYVLALSQNDVRLLRGSRQSVQNVVLQDVPTSLEEAMRFDEEEKQLQWRTETRSRPGMRGAMFHGHGVGKDMDRNKILRYFRQIDKGLMDVLKGEDAPLVLAGVEYLFPIYREATDYPHLMDGGVPGNPEDVSVEELHRRAWNIVSPDFEKERHEAADKFQQYKSNEKASDDLRKVLPAARQGRVESLFVARGVNVWGDYDIETDTARIHEERHENDRDLLDQAAVWTLARGGQVFAVQPEDVPTDGPVAAVYRF